MVSVGGYFCHSQDDRNTTVYETMAAAIAEACREKMAPFVIYQLVAQPIGQRHTNVVGRAFVQPRLTGEQLEKIRAPGAFEAEFGEQVPYPVDPRARTAQDPPFTEQAHDPSGESDSNSRPAEVAPTEA